MLACAPLVCLVPSEAREGFRSPELELEKVEGCHVGEQNLGPLQEQQVLLVAESAFQLPKKGFKEANLQDVKD